MKKNFFTMICFVAMGLCCLTGCEKDNDNNGGNNGGNNSPYSQMLVGTWRVTAVAVDGVNQQAPQNMLITMDANGTGLMNDNGEIENNGFTWSVSGNQLTITPRHGELTFNIVIAEQDTWTIEGYGEMAGMEGFLRITAVRVNNNNNNYGELAVGTWQLTSCTVNGESGDLPNVQLTMNANGSGVITVNGENNTFTWSISGDQLTIVRGGDGGSMTFTIISMDQNSWTIAGYGEIGGATGNLTLTATRVQ